jgi:predicted transcriptional regulator
MPTLTGGPPVRRLIVVLGLLAALLVVTGAPALADPPTALSGGVTDSAGALPGGDRARVESAIGELQKARGVGEYVVFVPGFDGMTGEQWAQRTARLTGLGSNDVLLAVAVDERHYGVHPGSGLDAATVRRVVVDDVQPRLSDGDWAGAAIALADGLGAGSGVGSSSSGGRSGGSSGALTLLVVVGLAVLAGGAYLLARSRRRRPREDRQALPASERLQRPDPYAGTPTEQLNYRASSALLDLDERVRTAQVDLDYARSYFGEEAVPGAAGQLATARDELSRAFAIRQELDDEVPEDEPTQRRMLAELLGLTDAASARLQAQTTALNELREREKSVPQVIDELQRRIAELHQRLPVQERRLEELRRRYASSAVTSVAENVREAGVRLAAAEQGLELARQDQASDQTGRAVGRLRGIEDAVGQSVTLLDGIDRLADDLTGAEQRVPAVRGEVVADLAEAQALVRSGDRSGLQPQIARAQAALGAADAALRPADGSPGDPLTALRQLEEADLALQQALSVARDAQSRTRRAAELLDQALLTGRSTTAAAADFISTRRGAVGPEARTRLAEAQRHLDAAEGLARTDPTTALTEAREADRLGQYALDLAQRDVERWSQQTGYGGYGGGTWGHGTPGYRGGISPLGAGLGGLLLGGLIFGGDHDRGDWSSGDWGGGGDWSGGVGGGGFGGDFGGGDFGGDF